MYGASFRAVANTATPQSLVRGIWRKYAPRAVCVCAAALAAMRNTSATRVLFRTCPRFFGMGLPPVTLRAGASRRCDTKAFSLGNFSSVGPYSLTTASRASIPTPSMAVTSIAVIPNNARRAASCPRRFSVFALDGLCASGTSISRAFSHSSAAQDLRFMFLNPFAQRVVHLQALPQSEQVTLPLMPCQFLGNRRLALVHSRFPPLRQLLRVP